MSTLVRDRNPDSKISTLSIFFNFFFQKKSSKLQEARLFHQVNNIIW